MQGQLQWCTVAPRCILNVSLPFTKYICHLLPPWPTYVWVLCWESFEVHGSIVPPWEALVGFSHGRCFGCNTLSLARQRVVWDAEWKEKKLKSAWKNARQLRKEDATPSLLHSPIATRVWPLRTASTLWERCHHASCKMGFNLKIHLRSWDTLQYFHCHPRASCTARQWCR